MSFYKEVPGRKTTLESILKFDTAHTAGSTNPVTSEGVKGAIDGAVGDVSAALQEQIDEIAEKAGSGYIPKGEVTVATLNALTGQENGELYTMTDSGTLTLGSLAVVAGDTVAWDATNEVWYKAMDYAPRQYGTNEVHNLPTTITAFRTGDVIPVDGPYGTAKMSKDDLLEETAENAVNDNIAHPFDSTRTSGNKYKVGETVSYKGKTYVVVVPHYGGWNSTNFRRCNEIDVTRSHDVVPVIEFVGDGNDSTPVDWYIPYASAGEKFTHFSVEFPDGVWDSSNVSYSLYVTCYDEDGTALVSDVYSANDSEANSVVVIADDSDVEGNAVKGYIHPNTALIRVRARGNVGEKMRIRMSFEYGTESNDVVNNEQVHFSLQSVTTDTALSRKDILLPKRTGDTRYYVTLDADNHPDGSSTQNGFIVALINSDNTYTDVVQIRRSDISSNIGVVHYFDVPASCLGLRISFRSELRRWIRFTIGSGVNERITKIEADSATDPLSFDLVGQGTTKVSQNTHISTSGGYYRVEISSFTAAQANGYLYVETRNSDDMSEQPNPLGFKDANFTSGDILYVPSDAILIRVTVRAAVDEVVHVKLTNVTSDVLAESYRKMLSNGAVKPKNGSDPIPAVAYEGEPINIPKINNYYGYREVLTMPTPSVSTGGKQAVLKYGSVYLLFTTNTASYPAAITIFNDEGTILGCFQLGDTEAGCHCNCASFGEKYDAGDNLPLIYLSSNTQNYRCFVLRIANDYQSYTLVQTIQFTGTRLSSYTWCDWCVDMEKSCIWAYQKDGANADRKRRCLFLKFKLPALTSASVSLVDSDIQYEIYVEDVYINQSIQIIGNKVYADCGLDGTISPFELVVADLGCGAVLSRGSLSWLGEPEGIFIDDGKLYVSKSKIYELIF